jgi:serine/threonine-protein kinase
MNSPSKIAGRLPPTSPPVTEGNRRPSPLPLVSSLPRINGYELIEKIGEGGMASVYKASCSRTGKIVAVKILSEEMAAKPVLRKRFDQEIRAATRLAHPNIVATLDHGESTAGPYLVMEYVEGTSLGEWIEREGALPAPEAIRLLSQVARALDYAHQQGVIHRDVKPDNILITPNGEARLADFGLVKILDDDIDLTRPGTGLGTPNFIAPEQLAHAKAIDQRCDVYALGATLYMAVTGRLPFPGRTLLQVVKLKSTNELILPRQVMPSVSEHLERSICRAMHPDRGQRPTSCGEFLHELTQRGGPPASTPAIRGVSTEARSERPSRWAPKTPGANVATPHNAAQDTEPMTPKRGTKPSTDPSSRAGLGWSYALVAAAMIGIAAGAVMAFWH